MGFSFQWHMFRFRAYVGLHLCTGTPLLKQEIECVAVLDLLVVLVGICHLHPIPGARQGILGAPPSLCKLSTCFF